MTYTDGKWYSRELHRWDDFEIQHNRTYNMFLETLRRRCVVDGRTPAGA